MILNVNPRLMEKEDVLLFAATTLLPMVENQLQ